MRHTKPWYESKAVWGGLLLVAIGIYELIVQKNFENAMIAIGQAMGVIGIRLAQTSVK